MKLSELLHVSYMTGSIVERSQIFDSTFTDTEFTYSKYVQQYSASCSLSVCENILRELMDGWKENIC